jgi:hypothetical protein
VDEFAIVISLQEVHRHRHEQDGKPSKTSAPCRLCG